jgi:hypothetical protein
VQVRVDSHFAGTAMLSVSTANTRVPLSAAMMATGVPAKGDHLITIEVLSDAPATRTDVNDLFTVTVLELPF